MEFCKVPNGPNLLIKWPFEGPNIPKMGDAYPELIQQQKLISKVIEEEET